MLWSCSPDCRSHYVQQGGVKAVIWTDVFQIIVMFSGFVAISVHGTVLVGGPARVLEIANNGSRINFNKYKNCLFCFPFHDT